jgi:Flp pilus assembly protein TadG
MRGLHLKGRTVRVIQDGAYRLFRKPRRLLRDQRGNIAIITALVLPVVVGVFALGFETAYWDQTQRSMQNAADSAAGAAATNGTSTYLTEARAVASLYGFTNGANNVTVTASNTAACPGGGNTCYSVTISRKVPLFMAQVAGYHGDTTYNGGYGKQLTAVAVATKQTSPRNYCLLALASSGAEGIQANGVPFANLQGCNTMSNTSSVCNGHNLNAGYGDAHGTNSGCGVTSENGLAVVPDPYSNLVNYVPNDGCNGTYPQEPAKKKDPALPASNLFTGNVNMSGNYQVCGDMQLSGDVVIHNTSGSAVLVIENGQLDTNGHKISTASGSQVTIVFSGSGNGTYTHAPTGGGTLDIEAPRSGNWSGVALYQDPRLSSGVDISAAGNSPTWDITGLVYLPHSTVTFSGAVNKSSNGYSCFALVVDNVTINGTGSILDEGQCAQAGLNMPSAQVPGRGQLVG